VNPAILDDDGRIDPHKIDLVGRLGSNHYVRASGNAIFDVAKPTSHKAIGVDTMPAHVRLSNVLTGNNLGQLGNVESLPTEEEIRSIKNEERLQDIFHRFQNDPANIEI